jgi:hypothetical protein
MTRASSSTTATTVWDSLQIGPDCALVTRVEHEFLAEELLVPSLAQEEAAILKGFGINRPS